jgi:hypothetical protein
MALAINLPQAQAIIANGQSLSAAIGLGATPLHAIAMPAAWDAAALTFQGSIDGATWLELTNASGSAISVTAAAGQLIVLDPTLWRAVNFIKVRSGTSGAPVNQTAQRTLTLILRPIA